jgi:hypothetical protein
LRENENEYVDGKATTRVIRSDAHAKPSRRRRLERPRSDHRLVLPPSEKLLAVSKRCEALPRNMCPSVATHHAFRRMA